MRPQDAAVAAARRLGVVVAEPVTLSDSNNVVVWLKPSPVVGKVAAGHHRRLAVELSVARHLVSCGAPVVPPAGQVPQEVHRAGGFEVTFWEHQRPGGREADERELAGALFRLHQALLSYPGPLPSHRDELLAVAGVLGDPARMPALPAGDRALLLAALARFGQDLARYAAAGRPLHGSPHSSNTIAARGGVRFIDLETACTGPLEWDLAHVGGRAAHAYPGGFDPAVLGVCRALVSVKTAAWCWARFEHPALQWHARHHLAVVTRLMAQRLRRRCILTASFTTRWGPWRLPGVAGEMPHGDGGCFSGAIVADRGRDVRWPPSARRRVAGALAGRDRPAGRVPGRLGAAAGSGRGCRPGHMARSGRSLVFLLPWSWPCPPMRAERGQRPDPGPA